MSCFWTDLVGVSQDCGSSPTVGYPLAIEWTQYPASFPDITFWPLQSVAYTFPTSSPYYHYSFGSGDVVALGSLYIKRVLYILSESGGCDTVEATPPAWFPDNVAALGGLGVGGTTSYEADNLAIELSTTTDLSGNPAFTGSVVTMLLATGAPSGSSPGVFFVEAVGSDGNHYFGFGNVNSCF